MKVQMGHAAYCGVNSVDSKEGLDARMPVHGHFR